MTLSRHLDDPRDWSLVSTGIADDTAVFAAGPKGPLIKMEIKKQRLFPYCQTLKLDVKPSKSGELAELGSVRL